MIRRSPLRSSKAEKNWNCEMLKYVPDTFPALLPFREKALA
jgi:hypothetical protein